jgi:hypothetical protein
MLEPMSDARLAEIDDLLADWPSRCGHREPERIVRELLAEAKRARAEVARRLGPVGDDG